MGGRRNLYMSNKEETLKVKMYISGNSTLCSGCRRCELACSLFHHGECNPELAGIHVLKDTFSGDYEIKTCLQCKEPRCETACPVQAIGIAEKTGARIINENICIGCRSCEEACQFHMVGFVPEKNICFKCDLCGGDPQCLSNCPYNAVTIAEIREEK
jgi:anaerobic carbon-monoxide dehydrogenase iron sulfur subunit